MDRIFKLKENGTDARTEIIAGFTSFMTMAYILAVNPNILSASGLDSAKVFSATAIASAIATLVMGLVANLPFGLSAGMGINAYFAYTVVLGMGYSPEWALSAVFAEGLIFILLTFCNVREAIVNSIPANLKKAIGAGIGLFIAYIGLQDAGIVIASPDTCSMINPRWFTGSPLVAVIGTMITAFLVAKKVKAALLIGIVATTVIGIPFGVTTWHGGSWLPTAPYFCHFAFKDIFANSQSVFNFIIVMFTFLFVDMFDTVGTLIACAGKSGIIREDGSIPNCKEALLADAIGTTAGAMLGTSTVTAFVESSSGVAAGGRTGLTSVTISALFLFSLFLFPLFGAIPGAATAPALIIVGLMMIAPVKDIDFSDATEGVPAFLTILFTVCAYSISDGIMFGVISYVLLKAFTGRGKELSVTIWVVFALFVAKTVVSVL